MLRNGLIRLLSLGKNQFELEALLVGNLPGVPAEIISRVSKYVLLKQNRDGGFSGRLGNSDIYYTAFALRSARLLGLKHPEFWKKAARFVSGIKTEELDLAGLVSFLQSADILERSAGRPLENGCIAASRKIIKSYAGKSGGFRKSPADPTLSVYSSFLALLALSKLRETYPEPKKAALKILKRQMKDGGFSELGFRASGRTNPSAAAVMTLFALGLLPAAAEKKAAAFFSGMQAANGGFLAHAKAPVPDLLSTYTSLLTLKALGRLKEADSGKALAFVNSLEGGKGGFKAVEIDNDTDLEYTYYGLGCLGILEC